MHNYFGSFESIMVARKNHFGFSLFSPKNGSKLFLPPTGILVPMMFFSYSSKDISGHFYTFLQIASLFFYHLLFLSFWSASGGSDAAYIELSDENYEDKFSILLFLSILYSLNSFHSFHTISRNPYIFPLFPLISLLSLFSISTVPGDSGTAYVKLADKSYVDEFIETFNGSVVDEEGDKHYTLLLTKYDASKV